jgi:hypothetical protein
MLAIDIDISGPVEEFNLLLDESKNLSNSILDRVVNEYMQKWETLVNQSLNRTKSEYLKAMRFEKIDDYNSIIRLDPRESKLALMIEEGSNPYDIKEGLKKSSKTKQSIGGNWYIDVPFRFATSKAIATSPVFSGIMPSQIERIAKKAAPASVPQSKLPPAYQKPSYRDTINKGGMVYPKYDHKVSVYDRIRRVQTGKRGGKYMTFRRVSENSDPNSWIHEGFTARNFMDQVLNDLDMDAIVDNVIQTYLDERYGG